MMLVLLCGCQSLGTTQVIEKSKKERPGWLKDKDNTQNMNSIVYSGDKVLFIYHKSYIADISLGIAQSKQQAMNMFRRLLVKSTLTDVQSRRDEMVRVGIVSASSELNTLVQDIYYERVAGHSLGLENYYKVYVYCELEAEQVVRVKEQMSLPIGH